MGEFFRSGIDDEVVGGLVAPFHEGKLAGRHGVRGWGDLLVLGGGGRWFGLFGLGAKTTVASDCRDIGRGADIVGA